MLFKIDSRESNQDLWDAFDILAYEKGFEYISTGLDTGDVTCGNVVIERKTASDFISSIMDSRGREQPAKMCLNYKYKYIIVEGNPFRTKSAINHNAIIGKMSSLLVKYEINILFVDTPVHFVYACYSIIRKHMDGETFDPEDFIQLKYKTTDEHIITAMIHQIPGLGYDKAKTIAEKYNNSFSNMVNEISIESLQEIEGIGKVTAEKVYEIIKK